jgi:hypothetical protein
MNLRQLLANNVIWQSPHGPDRGDFVEFNNGLQPVPTSHPPSNRNPILVKQDYPTDGWHRGDSAEARKKAMEDLVTLHQRMRRQYGKPEVSQTAQLPVFPNYHQWL